MYYIEQLGHVNVITNVTLDLETKKKCWSDQFSIYVIKPFYKGKYGFFSHHKKKLYILDRLDDVANFENLMQRLWASGVMTRGSCCFIGGRLSRAFFTVKGFLFIWWCCLQLAFFEQFCFQCISRFICLCFSEFFSDLLSSHYYCYMMVFCLG